MHEATILMWLVVIGALAFDYINGFHDTANAIATVVSTRVLKPGTAILMAAGLNLLGAVVATEVAKTIAGDIVNASMATEAVVLAAVLGGIVWNIITWKFGIPSSSSHALIGGLCGAAIMHAGPDVVHWSHLTQKVLIPLVASPLAGFILGGAVMVIISVLFARAHPHHITTFRIPLIILGSLALLFVATKVFHFAYEYITVPKEKIEAKDTITPLFLLEITGIAFVGVAMITLATAGTSGMFRRLQVLSAASMAFAHGQNDAQKSMGIITLALVSNGMLKEATVPTWVKLSCAIAMALGTSAGGWRIIKTMGHKIIRLEPVNGFAAETAGAAVILTASHFGMPVSTTHCIAGSIFGVGASKRLSAVRWQVAYNMVVAWVLTLPAAAAFGAIFYLLLKISRI